jgi:uncharacterized protein (TIGR02145 family)
MYKITRLITIIIVLSAALISCKKSSNPPTSSVPIAITNQATWVGSRWATLKAQVNGKAKLTTVTFEYDTTTSYTLTVSPSPDTTSGNTLIYFSSTITGLKPDTKYHYRVNAVSTEGSVTGTDVSFTTTDSSTIVINFNPELVYDSIYDFEGNKYRTIVIGNQTWMAENLKSIKFNDGTDIPFVCDATQWLGLTTPGYCWYNADSVAYGALYNWYTVSTGNLCPAGWHVPSDDEWTTLTDFLGGRSDAGGPLKETGTSHWLSPNTGATNLSGFTGLPSGYRTFSGSYRSIRDYGFWWTSTEWSSNGAWYRDVYYAYNSVDRSNSSKNSGANIRCIKD